MAVGPLKLILRVIDGAAVQGGKAIALCTEDGQLVGKQTACIVSSEVGEIGHVTVSFYIDGEHIRFADNDG